MAKLQTHMKMPQTHLMANPQTIDRHDKLVNTNHGNDVDAPQDNTLGNTVDTIPDHTVDKPNIKTEDRLPGNAVDTPNGTIRHLNKDERIDKGILIFPSLIFTWAYI